MDDALEKRKRKSSTCADDKHTDADQAYYSEADKPLEEGGEVTHSYRKEKEKVDQVPKKRRKFGITIRPRVRDDTEEIEFLWEDTEGTFYEFFKKKAAAGSWSWMNTCNAPRKHASPKNLKRELAQNDGEDDIEILYEGPSPYASASSSQGSSSSSSSGFESSSQ